MQTPPKPSPQLAPVVPATPTPAKGPIIIALARADQPTKVGEINRIWITVSNILALHPTSPGTPPGTAVWVAQQQAFIVHETVDQILGVIDAQVIGTPTPRKE